jgi:HEAT repeat protein
MNRILTDTKDGEIRKAVVASLISMGEMGRRWALKSMADKQNNWEVHYCALMILRNSSRFPEDFETARAFITHENERLREEAVGLITVLLPFDAESLVIDALNDPEARVRWRAMRALSDISPISEAAINKIIELITMPAPKEKQGEASHKRKIMNLIIAIKSMPEIPAASRMETAVLVDLLWKLTENEKGLLKFFKKGTVSDEDAGIIKASLLLLSRIGTTASEAMLTKIRRKLNQFAGEIDSALKAIQNRGSVSGKHDTKNRKTNK